VGSQRGGKYACRIRLHSRPILNTTFLIVFICNPFVLKYWAFFGALSFYIYSNVYYGEELQIYLPPRWLPPSGLILPITCGTKQMYLPCTDIAFPVKANLLHIYWNKLAEGGLRVARNIWNSPPKHTTDLMLNLG
jgi:hypothetical protein